jgi:hypothetical protein
VLRVVPPVEDAVELAQEPDDDAEPEPKPEPEPDPKLAGLRSWLNG